jgi:hypothetical protein
MHADQYEGILLLEDFTGDAVLDELRDRMISFLSQNQVCVIATSGSFGAWAVPAPYGNKGLELICRLPRWLDAIYLIEQEPRVMVIVVDAQPSFRRWLQYHGVAYIAGTTDDRYVAIHIAPQRIDLFDECRDWGARETLDF